MLIIKESEVKELISLSEVIEINEQVFIKESKGDVICPHRIVIPIEKNDKTTNVGNLYFKPSLVVEESIGLKIVGTFRGNLDLNLPTVPATIVLNDIETGIVNAIVAATYITGLRTAAGSTLAVKYLSTVSPSTLFVYGSGLQAKLHIQMILYIKPTISKVYIASRTISNIEKLIQELKQESIHKNKQYNQNVEYIYQDVDQHLLEADIIVTATASNDPLFNGEKLFKDRTAAGKTINNKPLLICSVGSSRPTCRELDSFTICNSIVIVDDYNSVLASGELAIPISEGKIIKSHISSKLCDVISAGNQQTINNTTSCIVYKSSGTAIQDIATAYLVYKKALQNNIGINIDMNN